MSVFYMSDLTLLQLKTLWVLNKNPSCGYDLMSKIRKKKMTQGTIYPLLRSLEKIRLIKSSKEGARGKKIYFLTKKGEKILVDACKDFCELYNEIFEKYVCKECKK